MGWKLGGPMHPLQPSVPTQAYEEKAFLPSPGEATALRADARATQLRDVESSQKALTPEPSSPARTPPPPLSAT